MLVSNDKTIVIITYDYERYLLEINLRSINKYLEPCEIIIIYCDKNLQYNNWLTWAQKCIVPLIPNHTIHLYDCNYFYQASTVKNWRNFAYALKLFASSVVSSDCYWSLDSKSFFFKPTIFTQLLEEFPRDLFLEGYRDDLSYFSNTYEIQNTKYKMWTHPFKFITSICREMVAQKINFELHPDLMVNYSEQLNYQAFCYKNNIELSPGQCSVNNSIAYPGRKYSAKQLIAYMKSKDPAVRCTGIHVSVAEKFDKNTFNAIITYVGGKDLIPKSTPWTFN